jgi:hypothetical protein
VSGVILIGKICSDENAFITSFTSDGIGVKIPEGVTSIESDAFEDPYTLYITLSDAPKRFIEYVTSIELPDGLENICRLAFQACGSLTSIKIPYSVTNIGSNAFPRHIKPSNVIIDNNPAYKITDGVIFSADGSVLHTYLPANERTVYTVPDSVTTIQEFAFDRCKNLVEIIVPDSVTSIGRNAFCGCDNIEAITLPDSFALNISSIGLSAEFSYQYWKERYLEALKSKNTEELLKVGIDALDLSVRSYNCLARAGILTIGDIIGTSETDLSKVRNLGRKSYDEVIQKLTDIGLSPKEQD